LPNRVRRVGSRKTSMLTVILTITSDETDIEDYKEAIGNSGTLHIISANPSDPDAVTKKKIERYNKIIVESDSNSDILLLSDQIELYGDFDKFLENIRKCLYVAEKHAIAYGQEIENKESLIKTAEKYLPDYSVTVKTNEHCALIKRTVLNKLGVLDTEYSSLHYALSDYYYRINKYGFSSVTAHSALIFFNEEKRKFGLGDSDKELFESRHPLSFVTESRYAACGVSATEHFLKVLDDEYYPKKRILFDCSIMPSFHNGTSEHQKNIYDKFCNLFKDKYDIHLLVSEEADKFHKLSEKYENIIYPETISGAFHLGFVPSQLLLPDAQATMNRHCIKVVQVMLDIIMVRIDEHFSASGDLSTMCYGRIGIGLSDGIAFISEYTKDDFIARFSGVDELKNKKLKVIYPAGRECLTGKRDYELPFDEYFLIVGNHYFAHKATKEAIETIGDTEYNYIVIGYSNFAHRYSNICCYLSGRLEEDFLNCIYDNCKAIIFPSLYEGFGFPLIMGFQRKKRIIVNNNTLNNELKKHFSSFSSYITFFDYFYELREIVKNIDFGVELESNEYIDTWDRVAIEYESFFSEILGTPTDIVKLNDRFQLFSLLEAKQMSLKQKNTEIIKLSTEIYKRDVTIKRKNDEVFWKYIEAERIQYELDVVNIHYNAIENSFWWKITKPARVITNGSKWVLKSFPLTRPMVEWLINKRNQVPTEESAKPITDTTFNFTSQKRKVQENYKFSKKTKISIVTPLYNTPEKFLHEMIDSVRMQTYSNWELCLADGSDAKHEYVGEICAMHSKEDVRIKYTKLEKNGGISYNSNQAIKLSTGEYIGLLDHDDILHPAVLFEVMKEICDRDADYIYTDEVIFEENPLTPKLMHCKPDFSIDNLRANNYICHFSCFRKKLLDEAGLYNPECDGSQDHDMAIRIAEVSKIISHIPMFLYYWRSHEESVAGAKGVGAKSYAIKAAKKAVQDHLDRVGLKGVIEDAISPEASIYRVKYKIKGTPLISIAILSKDNTDNLKRCLGSIFSMSTYKNIEIIIAENNSLKAETFEYYGQLENNPQIKIITCKGEWNYSKLNNAAVEASYGEFVMLLDNNVEVISPEWIEEMLMFAQRADVGAVGAKLYYPEGKIKHAGYILNSGPHGVVEHMFHNSHKNEDGYMGRLRYAQNVSAVSSICMMLRREVFEETHGLDEKLELAYSDVDLCLKIRKKGYLNVFTPFAELYHHETKSDENKYTPEQQTRFLSEVALFKERWKENLKNTDPYYNPNFSQENGKFIPQTL